VAWELRTPICAFTEVEEGNQFIFHTLENQTLSVQAMAGCDQELYFALSR